MQDSAAQTVNTAIQERVTAFVRENFLYDDTLEIAPHQSLLASGLIDSTGVLELVGFLEERFGVAIADGDLTPSNLDSISQITSFLHRKLAAR